MNKTAIFLGSKPGGVVALERLIERGWEVKAVILPKNIDLSWIKMPSLEAVCIRNLIPIYKDQSDIFDIEVDFVISYLSRNLVKKPLRHLAKIASVNFHPGPLPKYAGYAFYNLAILEESEFYGCTCHHMDDGFDTGDLIKVRSFPIDSNNETAYSLERKTQLEMLRLFDDFLDIAECSAAIPSKPQDPEAHRYLSRLQFDKLKVIKPGAEYAEVQKIARAFWYPPYLGAHYIDSKEGKVQIVPDIVMRNLGELLHVKDFEILQNTFHGDCSVLQSD